MAQFVEKAGCKFGRLTVVERGPNKDRRVTWACVCDCGKEVVVLASSLGRTTLSCGCLALERRRAKGKNATHGSSKTRTYGIWAGLRRRCQQPTDDAWPNYGGRGIRVCDRWADFAAFITDMGEAPINAEIDRIDVDGDYEPKNCRWTDLTTQANNKRNNRIVPSGVTVAEFARVEGLKYATAYYRCVVRGNAPHRSEIHTMARMHMADTTTLEWE